METPRVRPETIVIRGEGLKSMRQDTFDALVRTLSSISEVEVLFGGQPAKELPQDAMVTKEDLTLFAHSQGYGRRAASELWETLQITYARKRNWQVLQSRRPSSPLISEQQVEEMSCPLDFTEPSEYTEKGLPAPAHVLKQLRYETLAPTLEWLNSLDEEQRLEVHEFTTASIELLSAYVLEAGIIRIPNLENEHAERTL